MNTNLRKFKDFFDRTVVKIEGYDTHPGIRELQVSVAQGGSQSLWLGEKKGQLHRLNNRYDLSPPVQAFDRELFDIRVLDDRNLIVAIGSDNPSGRDTSSGGTRYKVYDVRKEGEASLLANNRVFPARVQEQRVTGFDVNSALSVLAVGLETGTIHFFRGRDLSQDRPQPVVLGKEGTNEPPITGVHFLELKNRTVLFACNMLSVRSWSVDDNEVRELNVDCSGGACELCSCVFPTTSALLVAKGEAVFAYDPDEGNMSAIPLEGDKVMLSRFKSYFVAVSADTADNSRTGGLTRSAPAPPSALPKYTVNIVLAYPRTRFSAYNGQFTDVTHVFTGFGSVFVLTRGGAERNNVLFQLEERPLQKQLDFLTSKGMFEWAADIAINNGAPSENVAAIHRQQGDRLFDKRAYDQALTVYLKTVDLGLPLEPSYIVEKYLDAQRIGHVAKYLKRLHEKNMAEREHTALLLKCYTKLKDFGTLQEFLESTPVTQYDPTIAIEVLEAAEYYGLAAAISQKAGVDKHEDYVRIKLEYFKQYAEAVKFLKGLPRQEASKILLDRGRPLMKHAPEETIELTKELCGLNAGAHMTMDSALHVDDFLSIFVEDLSKLEGFLRSILLADGGCQLPQPEAERLFPTLLELLVRSHQSTSQEGDQQKTRPLHEEIMRLIRQYKSDQCLQSTLLLCQTYDFVDGFFYAAEGLGRYQLLMNWCFEQRDAKRLLQVCKDNGPHDQSLWVQALTFLVQDESDPVDEIGEVLRHIEESDLMPLTMVIETLQQNPRISLDVVRSYLQGQFRKLSESVDSSRGKARQDRQEIERMQKSITNLRTKAQEFQNRRCSQCDLDLEVPAIHFFCNHSYHAHCMPQDDQCPICSSDVLQRNINKEQRLSQARNTEDFFKYVQGTGEASIQAMGVWCGYGAFDVS